MTPTPREVWQFGTRHVGRKVLVYDCLPSTNDVAIELARDATHAGTVVAADFQSAGRGQYGRAWHSRAGTSLLMSLVLAPPPACNRPVLLTAFAAVALGDAVRDMTGTTPSIKWPNDLLVGGRKLAGILIEQHGGTVVGLGLNLNQTEAEFAEANLHATSLGVLSGRPVDAASVIGVALRRLDEHYAELLDGQLASLERAWGERMGLLHRHARATLADGTYYTGRLTQLGFDAVEIELGDGAFVALRPETVRHLAEA